MRPTSTIQLIVFSLSATLVACFSSAQPTSQHAFPCDAPSSIKLSTNAPASLEVCGSTQWTFDVDYTEGDFYQWKILQPAIGSIVAGNHTPHIEVLFNNPKANYEKVRLGVIVAVTKCNQTLHDTLVMYIKNLPQYTATPRDTIIYSGDEVPFSISPTPKGFKDLTWHFGDGDTSSVANLTRAYPYNNKTVMYYPTATIYNPEGCPGKTTVSASPVEVVPSHTALASQAGKDVKCDLRYTVLCGSDSLYDITLFDHSNLLSREIERVNQYAYRKGSGDWQEIEAPDTALTVELQLLPGHYEFRQTIYGNSNSEPACSTVIKVHLPEKPVSDFETTSQFESPCVSEGVIHFENKSTPSNGLDFVWDFGDATLNYQTNPRKVYGGLDFVGTVYAAILVASNAFGCKDTTHRYIEVEGNELWDGKIKPNLIVNPSLPQAEGTPITLAYFNFAYAIPPKLVWYNGNTPIKTTEKEPYIEITEPGMYWALGIDEYGCIVPSDQVPITYTDE